jgi:pantothenate kinase
MTADIAHLLAAARRDGRRRVLGIAGGPGAGKSSLAASLAGPEVAVVGMDGWHLANSVLDRLDRRDRKGAPDTFDAPGYVAFLERVRSRATTVWAPEFRREIEEPIAGALEVPPAALVVVTEGNYLLVDEGDWGGVRPLLDEAWFVETDEDVRRARLIARHVEFGKEPEYARAWVLRSDERNAALVASTRERADLVIRMG